MDVHGWWGNLLQGGIGVVASSVVSVAIALIVVRRQSKADRALAGLERRHAAVSELLRELTATLGKVSTEGVPREMENGATAVRTLVSSQNHLITLIASKDLSQTMSLAYVFATNALEVSNTWLRRTSSGGAHVNDDDYERFKERIEKSVTFLFKAQDALINIALDQESSSTTRWKWNHWKWSSKK